MPIAHHAYPQGHRCGRFGALAIHGLALHSSPITAADRIAMRTFGTIALALCACVPIGADAAEFLNDMDDTIVELYVGGVDVLADSGAWIVHSGTFELSSPAGPRDVRVVFDGGQECTIAGVDFAQTPLLSIDPGNCNDQLGGTDQ